VVCGHCCKHVSKCVWYVLVIIYDRDQVVDLIKKTCASCMFAVFAAWGVRSRCFSLPGCLVAGVWKFSGRLSCLKAGGADSKVSSGLWRRIPIASGFFGRLPGCSRVWGLAPGLLPGLGPRSRVAPGFGASLPGLGPRSRVAPGLLPGFGCAFRAFSVCWGWFLSCPWDCGLNP
jgi:hypothetical protein